MTQSQRLAAVKHFQLRLTGELNALAAHQQVPGGSWAISETQQGSHGEIHGKIMGKSTQNL
jgi:hypothetical protein